jgi:hypothetical protein
MASLPPGTRVTDYIGLGVIARTIPLERVLEVLKATGLESQRQRQLPAHFVVYYVIALALYLQVSYGEVLRTVLEAWSQLDASVNRMRETSKAAISQARSRLGAEPFRRLFEQTARRLATKKTRGAWYRRWRLVAVDGTCLDVADSQENAACFGRCLASRGHSAFPQVRLVGIAECGTHAMFAARIGPYSTSERQMAAEMFADLDRNDLLLADRGFISFKLWEIGRQAGAALLWRLRKDQVFEIEQELADGSYLSTFYPSASKRHARKGGVPVRVICYRLEGDAPTQEYRLLTTILDPKQAPAAELAALYTQRWEIETAINELKTHLRGRRMVLRSKTPELVQQEVYGFLLAHFAVREIMHEAALNADIDPDELSFVHAVRIIRRQLARDVPFSPSG